jgi:hypothetical protein
VEKRTAEEMHESVHSETTVTMEVAQHWWGIGVEGGCEVTAQEDIS